LTPGGLPRYNSRLMSRRLERLPVQVDPFRLAQAGRVFEGEIPLRQMKRLQPLLYSHGNTVRAALEFGIDSLGVSFLSGRIQAELEVVCQRCLEPMGMTADIRFDLAFVHQAIEGESIPEPYEPYVVESVPVTLTDIIEDELLLFLPPITRHELEVCPARNRVQMKEPAGKDTAKQAEEQRHNPFSVLANLKTPNKVK